MKVGSEAAVANGGASVVYTAGITVMLAFLYAAQSIAVTYSKDDPNAGTFSYDPNSAVMSTEMLKLCLASGLFYRQLKGARSGGEMPGFAFDPKVVVKFAIPALIYMAGNNILFIALKYLDAPTYQVLGNIKIIVVAIIQRLALKSQKTVVQWLGVALLMLGMMVIGASKLDSHEKGSAKADTLMLGLFWMVCIALCSAFAGVYTEFLLKKLEYSTDFQNMLLYSWGVIFCLLGNASGTMGDSTASEQGFFTGFSGRTWLVVVINAFLGQVVSRVMKYADNITKVFAASSGVVITMVLSTYLFDFSMTLLFNLGTGVVVVASIVYFSPQEFLLTKL